MIIEAFTKELEIELTVIGYLYFWETQWGKLDSSLRDKEVHLKKIYKHNTFGMTQRHFERIMNRMIGQGLIRTYTKRNLNLLYYETTEQGIKYAQIHKKDILQRCEALKKLSDRWTNIASQVKG